MNRARLPCGGAPRFGVLLALGLLLAGCGRVASPEEVALAYGRAVYANDADAIWRLVSEADRRAKNEATFRRQQRELRGFTREVVLALAGLIGATPVTTDVTGHRARVTLGFRLPDANAPEIRTLMLAWDEDRLNRLPGTERARILDRLGQLHRGGRFPTVKGDETFDLVRENGRWRVFLNWAGGVRVRFEAAVDPGVPLRVTVTPNAAVLAPGERLRVTVRATNTGNREVTARVGHRIAPQAQATHLALVQCPLFVPVTLEPRETEEFVSEYLLLADVPADTRTLAVTYLFPAAPPSSWRRLLPFRDLPEGGEVRNSDERAMEIDGASADQVHQAPRDMDPYGSEHGG